MKRSFIPTPHPDGTDIREFESRKPILEVRMAAGASRELAERAVRLIQIMFDYESFPGQNALMDVTLAGDTVVMEFASDEAATLFHEHVKEMPNGG